MDSNIPPLPLELVTHHILQELRDEAKTLKNCALVSHAWLPASQRILKISVLTPLLPLLLPHLSHFPHVTELVLNGCRSFHDLHWDVAWTHLLATDLPSLTRLTTHYLTFENLTDLIDLVSAFPNYTIRYAGPQTFSALHLRLDADAGDVNPGAQLVKATGSHLKQLTLSFDNQWHLCSIHEMDEELWTRLIDILMSSTLASLRKVSFFAETKAAANALRDDISANYPAFFAKGIAIFSSCSIVKPVHEVNRPASMLDA
ncbi:F-box domain-containing protein [Favolaschia claudopus]|uniref:F-box domain-containing protein n=1 Tax=Favolaschia claudopus TaxID=2862362 RepID=A0AAW0DZL0_9AGAR